MFRITTTHLFWWPVTVRMPDPTKPGAVSDNTFQMQFEAITDDRAREIDANDGEADPAKRAKNFIAAICRNWRDVADEDGAAMPFSSETLRSLSGLSWFRNGVMEAYTQAMAGQAARLGN